ncbi:MAG: hypothetical protein DRR06_14545 [Gammaproteobacteria bacterium]|nr:MAG: hypothetical protein DRR06_14545 [Gammaproteobacteria bacterium]
MLFIRRTLVCSLLIAASAYTHADITVIPDSLKAWIPWVLQDQTDHACPRIAQQPKQRRCVWPDVLAVDVTETTAQFTQNWQVFGKSWVILPGDTRYWPQDVLINNQPTPVLDRNGKPAVLLTSGKHAIKGSFSWTKPPQYLPVALETALIKLSRNGKKVAAQADQQGRLWLRDQRTIDGAGQKNDTLKVEVFRLLSDNIPMLLATEVRLAVAGKPREIVLGQLLPTNAEAMEFNSPLPARIEDDGRLRIQARAGEWRISLKARFLEPTTSFSMRKMDAHWPDQEIWSFRANPQLRGVKIEGAPAVDPSQIDIPANFANLPTYLLSTNETLALKEQYRGDATPAANRLSLNRTLWLDFDGSGATTKDNINGTFTHNWRLRASPELQLGRIVANDTPQLVTRSPGEEGTGIEIRHSQVTIEAINRIEPLRAVSATGWLHDFDKVDLTLHLPPGWLLWHTAGPDRIQSSWLSRWDLWDLFICLLIVGGLFRVLDWRWGLTGAITLALTYHEAGAPLVGWVALVAALPLLTVLPQGKLKQLINTVAHLALAGLVVVVITFTVAQVRKGIYPQLEQYRTINAGPYSYVQPTAPIASKIAMEAELKAKSGIRKSLDKRAAGAALNEPKQQRYRPTDNIQTGPGEPSWQWRQVNLGWSGPVKAETPLTLYLSPPWLTRTLKFVQVALVCLLLYGLGGRLLRHHWLFADREKKTTPGGSSGSSPGGSPAGITSMLLPLVFAFATQLIAPDVRAETFPPPDLLEQLKTTLTKAPDCAPQCAAVQQTHISLASQRLVLRQRVSAAAELAFPLPADKSWQPDSILVDNIAQPLSRAGNKLWVYLTQGSHNITLTATLNGDNIAIPFPLPAHNTTVNAPGWQVHGLTERRVTGGTLQLEKKVRQVKQDTLLPSPIKPFVQVQRQLNADLDWELITTVTRIAPKTGAINLRIPLLAGESVVTQNILTEQQHVIIALKARQRQVQWRSVIKPSQQLVLQAPDNTDWVEHWQILASPRWHIRGDGMPSIKTGVTTGPMVQLWRAWPGESLTLHAVQPQPVPGPTTTVESIEVDHRPGARSASLKLSMRVRTSLGGDYRIPQPAGADLQSIVIDGNEQTTPREGEYVVIPLHPGLQDIVISWELDAGVAQTTITPAFKLPTPANNIDIKLQLPRDRWPVFLNGPDIGPAMLYWGVLAVILVIAAALGMIVKRRELSVPVNTLQWLLLALGMSTVNMAGSIPVVIWFFAMEARKRRPLPISSSLFNIAQLGLIGLSIIALLSLFYTIPQSLLSAPDMQVTGNGSSNYFYQWYQDHSSAALPQAWVFSLPLAVFRIAMLLWSLWIVFALMSWIKWGWQCLSAGQLWNNQPARRVRKSRKKDKKNKKDEAPVAEE